MASTPIGLAEIRGLVGLLFQALHDAASDARPLESPTVASVRRDFRALIRSWLRPRLAAIVAISQNRRYSNWNIHEDWSDREEKRAASHKR